MARQQEDIAFYVSANGETQQESGELWTAKHNTLECRGFALNEMTEAPDQHGVGLESQQGVQNDFAFLYVPDWAFCSDGSAVDTAGAGKHGGGSRLDLAWHQH
ncbi:hypothetical protein GCM10022270_02410 [Terriglobus aquaticus]